MKYKVGDRVKILPGGVNYPACLIGKIGKIDYIYNCSGRFNLITVNSSIFMCRIAPKYVESYSEIGKQLLFSFMEEE